MVWVPHSCVTNETQSQRTRSSDTRGMRYVLIVKEGSEGPGSSQIVIVNVLPLESHCSR